MQRRTFLCGGLGTLIGVGTAGGGGSGRRRARPAEQAEFEQFPTPAYSLIPVVGDGKWVWKEPPQDETGYLEARQYEVKVGIQLQGQGNAGQLRATTPVPVELPEQKIESVDIQTQGCAARIRRLAPHAAQLALAAPSIVRGQVVTAVATFRLAIYKDYRGFKPEQFDSSAKPDRQVAKENLYNSPGIQTNSPQVRSLAKEVGGAVEHPWDRARTFCEWVRRHIKGRPGAYTSVVAALRDRVGDCEERAAAFVALCRATGIPARLVWVPNHNWAEFYLTDYDGRGHWIPAHTSAYSYFGWTGAHEMVLQKGDQIEVPEKKKTVRLLPDWAQWSGRRPRLRFTAELTPLAAGTAADPGPGARRKDEKGEWLVLGTHPLDKQLRDADRLAKRLAKK